MSTKDLIVAVLLHNRSPASILADQLRRAFVRTPKTSVVSPADDALEALTAGQRTSGRMTLQEIADAVSLKPPTVLTHLRQLCQEGRVIRTEIAGSNSPTYEAAPYFAASWCDPSQGILLQWRATAAVDWRYPLATRVRHAPAQRILSRLLPQLDKALGNMNAANAQEPPEVAAGLGMYAYGSAARGDARPGSDLDLLLVSLAPALPQVKKAVTKVVRSANLWSEMPIDLRIVEAKDLLAAPPPLLQALSQDGVTVHWWGDHPIFIEAEPVRTILANRGAGQRSGSP